MGLKTPLYDTHVSAHAKIVDFGGWDMPLSFGSQLEEHHAVRRDAGMFDVSHMCVIDLIGARAREFLRFLLANDVGRLTVPGRALYSCMLLPTGGVIDDLIAYFMTESWFRLVVNAGTRHKDLAWIREHAAPFGVAVRERSDLAMLAVQGPAARAKTAALLAAGASRRGARNPAILPPPPSIAGSSRAPDTPARTASRSCCRRRMPPRRGGRCVAQGVTPAGLGARDTLRLEAGMNLTATTWTRAAIRSSPAWAGRWLSIPRSANSSAARRSRARARAAATRRRAGARGARRVAQPPGRERGGCRDGRRAARRSHQRHLFADVESLHRARAARAASGTRVMVDIRGKPHAARVVKPPFVRNGKVLIEIQ